MARCLQPGHQRAFFVTRHTQVRGLIRIECLQGPHIGGRFHRDLTARVNQHLAHQVETLL